MATPEERRTVIGGSPVSGKYDATSDRESAFELLKVRAEAATRQAEEAQRNKELQSEYERMQKQAEKEAERDVREAAKESARVNRPAARRSDSAIEAMTKSVMRSAGSTLGRQLIRGVLGGIFKGR